ncbi:ABC transporter ATP-binding protein, partial [Frankia canadensis]
VRRGDSSLWAGLATMVDGSRAHGRPALFATVAGVVNGITMVLGAAAIGWATDHLIIPALAGQPVPAGTWWAAAGAILGVSLLRWITIVVRGVATGHVQYGSQARIRRALARRYLDLDLSWHRRHPPGRLVATAVTDVEALWLPMVMFYFAAGMAIMLVVTTTEMFLRDTAFGLVGLVLVAAVLGLNLLYQRLLADRAALAARRRGEFAALALESVEGGQVVRTLGVADRERARVGAAADRLRAATTSMGAVSSLFDPLLELLPALAILAVLAVGAQRVQAGALSVGALVEIVYLLLTIAIPLSVISRFLGMLPVSAAGRARAGEVLTRAEVVERGAATLTGSGPLALRARRLGLVRGDTRLLAGIDLDVRAGEILALVGATGAGKSTLVDLLGGLTDPTEGSVEIDGVDAADLARGEISAHVGVVPQTAWLFAASVRDNLQLQGHPRERRPYTEPEIWRALAAAGAADVVRALPDGLDTRVGERGARLSGGQRQRLCLARALLRDPRALLLDDATSALDPAVERGVLDTVARLRGQVSILIVGGRPSSVLIADRVAFLRGGRLVATGTHAALHAAEPDYRHILDAYVQQDARGAHA